MGLSKLFAVAAAVVLEQLIAGRSVVAAAEEPHVRSFFYAGGGYADDGTGSHIFRDQMYVEHLSPVDGATHETPIVLIHGQAQTGSNFLNKPDGGRGWASAFLAEGYEVYVVDQALRARSAWQPGHNAAAPSTYSAELIQQRFTAASNYNLWPQAVNHTQWPGTGVMGDPVFDAFYTSNVQFIGNATYQQTSMQDAGAALLAKIDKPAVVIGHSQGGILPILIADARPDLTKALVLLEPTGPPFSEAVFGSAPARVWGLTDVPLTYEPEVSDPETDLVPETRPARDENSVECVLQAAEDPAPRQLANLADTPILIMTGEASYHMPYDYCTAQYLTQAGCDKTEHIELGSVGIHGNGHMFFMEENSDDIYDVLSEWIGEL